MYSKKTINRFRNPRFSGEIKTADAVGEVGNLRCGDVMKVYLKVKNGVIKDAKFQTYGCIAAIASSDMVCEMVKGKTLDEAYEMSDKEIVDGLGELPPVKIHCSILGIRALRDAIDKFREKSK